MPVHMDEDDYGPYYQWGNQTKYYFNPNSRHSTSIAYDKAQKQGMAIWISRYYSQRK